MEHEEALVDHILKVSGNTSLPIHQDSGTTVVVFVVVVIVGDDVWFLSRFFNTLIQFQV